MKKLDQLFFGSIFLFSLILTSCSNYSSSMEKSSDLSQLSWETERVNSLHLISPLDSGGIDVYNEVMTPGRWYLVNKSQGCIMIPIFGNPEHLNFTQDGKCVTKIDTIPVGLLFGTGSHIGARNIKKVRIALFLPEYKLEIGTPAIRPVAYALKR